MKIRMWEKVFWGIIASLLLLSIIAILLNKGTVKVVKNCEVVYWSKTKAVAMFSLIFGTIGLVFWVIIKLFTGGFRE